MRKLLTLIYNLLNLKSKEKKQFKEPPDLIEKITNRSEKQNKLIQTSIEFDKAVTHVVSLIDDAYLLFKAGSYSSSVFCSRLV